MQKNDVSMSIEIPYKIFKADSGGINFILKSNVDIADHNYQPGIHLLSKNCPHDELYEIVFNCTDNTIYIKTGENVVTSFSLPEALHQLNAIPLWMSWHNQKICLGNENKTYFVYPRNITGGNSAKEFIGFVKFETNYAFDWIITELPLVYETIALKKNITGGALRWVTLDGEKLPNDALIGGFENGPLYIAKAMYRGSLCPGKYDPSKGKAYVPWGGQSHEKANFQILCGYNVKWVKCKDDNVPENALVAGTSEVRGEPLYIGRALVDHNLIVGKVHLLYKTCYLPYKDEEIECHEFEILVDLSIKSYGIPIRSKCNLNSYNKDQTCI